MATIDSGSAAVLGSSPGPASCRWQEELARAVRDPGELCRALGLPSSVVQGSSLAASSYGVLVPRSYLARIRPGDPLDPLLLQVLPRQSELEAVQGFATDPLEESSAAWRPGLLRKYRSRALIVTSRTCAVHCRFCFRRHARLGRHDVDLAAAVEQIAAEPSIREVILSGGDPLVLDDHALGRLMRRLAKIGHLRRVRLHTRLPIVIPQRVTDELLGWLRATRLTTVVVVQANHPAEIDPTVADALGRLVDAGVPVFNQAVLLRGVNDHVDVLAELCERLIDLRVMPYYLHQLDRVAGAAHFEVPEAAGRRLIRELRTRLPGYAVPRYVRETPGRPNKEVLA